MKKRFAKGLCLILALLLMLPSVMAVPLIASAASGSYITVASSIDKGLGIISYTGKNYRTGVTNVNQTYDLNAGFLIYDEVTDDTLWGVCAYSGAKEPPAGTDMGDLISLNVNGTYRDGLNNTGSGSHGSHYIVNSPSNDSSWGHSRGISMEFIFRCFYYANKHRKDAIFNKLDTENCSLQEAIAIAYRYEWDVRLIQYGNTGTWNNATRTWTVRDVNSWTKDTAHFGGVTDGNATHQAIVEAANLILVYAMRDADGISGKIQTKTENGANYLSYTLSNGETCELRCVAGPARGQGQADYQDVFAYKPATVEDESGKIIISKVNEHGEPLSRAFFGLYRDRECTSLVSRKWTSFDGVATFSDLTPGIYYVKEMGNSNDGYVKDETVYTAVVRAYQETVISNASDGKFYNYKPTGSWTPTARKVLNGETLKDNQFTFELYNASTNEKLQTVENKADGTVTFSPINYTAADIGKTYVYTVRELNGGGAYRYDSHKLTYTVSVSYDKANKDNLTISLSFDGDMTFTNEYDASYYGSIGIKKVDQFGNPLQGVVFDIRLNNAEGYTYATVTTNENGEAIFYDIGVGDGYVPMMYFREVSAPAGYTFDPEEAYPVLPVKGQLTWATAEPVVNQAATATWTPGVSKRLIGGTLQSGTCTFALYDEKGVQLQTVSNNGNNIPFTAITYTPMDAGKTYTYTVRELSSTIENSILDEHTVTFTVNVSLNGNVLTVNETVSGDTTFTNYVPKGSWAPDVKKELIGREPTMNEFAIELLDESGTVIGTYWNEYDPRIFAAYPSIEYTLADVGTHTYTVREKKGSDASVFYDEHVITYTVTVSYNAANGGALTVTETHTGDTTFTNYVPKGSWQPDVKKKLVGREPQTDEFAIELLNESGTVIGCGYNEYSADSFWLPPIEYTLADVGTHTYTVREQKGTDPSVVYDEHVITYTVNVSYPGTGTALTVTSTVEGDTTFTNYVPVKMEVNKVDPDGNALAGAVMLLEWSEDGITWQNVTYSATIIKGGCTNAALADGTLTTGDDGRLVFDGLYPGLRYRLTEAKAPEGMQLLIGNAFEGTLPTDAGERELSLRVVNQPVFELPATGGKGFWNAALAVPLLCVSIGLLLGGGSLKKKKS